MGGASDDDAEKAALYRAIGHERGEQTSSTDRSRAPPFCMDAIHLTLWVAEW